MKNALVLFSGTGSIDKALRSVDRNLNIVSVDINKKYNSTHCVDITKWKCPYKPHFFQFIWASPDCSQYSKALTQRDVHRLPIEVQNRLTDNLRDLYAADLRVKSALKLLSLLKPKYWVIENPEGSVKYGLQTRPFMRRYNKYKHICTYCKYGFPNKKPTCIWTNIPGVKFKHCDIDPCVYKLQHGHHACHSQEGSNKYNIGLKSTKYTYPVPKKLVLQLYNQCS